MPILDLLKDHTASAVAILFALLNVVGISFNSAVFAYFGVSYADYADAEDFLISAFKSPLALGYSFLMALIFGWFIARRMSSPGKSERLTLIGLAFYGLLAVIMIPAYTGVYAARAVEGESDSFLMSVAGFGMGSAVKVHCQMQDDNLRIVRVIEGSLVSEAGDMFLLAANSRAILVSKACVLLIENQD